MLNSVTIYSYGSILRYAQAIHNDNVEAGWWDDYPNKMDRFKTVVMLIVSEFGEAIEGHRKGLMDTHLPQYPMLQVEIADIAIRALDFYGAITPEINTPYFDMGKDFHIRPNEGKIDTIDLLYDMLTMFMVERFPSSEDTVYFVFRELILRCFVFASWNGFDLFEIMEAKRAYNKERLDHKRDARQAKGGKKY